MTLPRYLIGFTTSAAKDGRLDQAAWAKVPWSSDYVWIDAGDAAPERARFKALYDRTGLYFLFEFESETVGPQPLDVVFPHACEIFLDPEGRGRRYLEYAVNPDGVEHSQVWNGHLSVREWKAEDSVATIARVTHIPNGEGRETIRYEVSMPWNGMSSLCGKRPIPPRRGEAWRANFSRVEPHADYCWSTAGFYYMHNPDTFGWLVFAGDENPITTINESALRPLSYILPGSKSNTAFKLFNLTYWVPFPLMPSADGGYYGVNKCSVSKLGREGKAVWTRTRKDGLPQFVRSCTVVGDALFLYGNGMQEGMLAGVYAVEADGSVRSLAGIVSSELKTARVFAAGKSRLVLAGSDRFQIVSGRKATSLMKANGSVNCVVSTGETIVLGTSDGFEVYSDEGELLHRSTVAGGIVAAAALKDGVIGVSGKAGLFRIDGSGTCDYFPRSLAVRFDGLYADGDRFWATYIGGMALIEDGKVRWFDGPLGNAGFQVVGAARAADGTMVFLCGIPHGNWYTSSVTTSFLLAYSAGRWKRYTFRNGLPAYTSAITSIDERVFLSTQAGFYEFRP